LYISHRLKPVAEATNIAVLTMSLLIRHSQLTIDHLQFSILPKEHTKIMQNIHGPLAWTSVQDMARAMQVCIELAQCWAKA
jgi:hypothetical protein